MSTSSFSVYSEQELLDLKRSRGLAACAECQRRKLKCDKNFPCSSCGRTIQASLIRATQCDTGPIGRGRRVPRYGSLELSTAIHNMGNRIRQLEDALSQTTHHNGATHPLLRADLLRVKHPHEMPRGGAGDDTPSKLSDAFGALAINVAGTSRYFGPTAAHSAQGSSGGDRAEYAHSFAYLIDSFPFSGSDGLKYAQWEVPVSLEILLAQLPPVERAAELCDIYIAEASFYGALIMPTDLHTLQANIYSSQDLAPHSIAVLFFALAHAALADLSLPEYSPDAEALFDAGRAALALKSVFESTDIRTVQAVALAGLYYATGGPRYSIDSAWTMTSIALVLAQRLRLHRASSYQGFEEDVAQLRKAFFWELYSLETYQALSFSRPLTILLDEITCEFPADTEQSTTPDGRIVPGFFHIKWRFTKEVYSRAKGPKYNQVMELDRKLRQFMEGTRETMAHYATESSPSRASKSTRSLYFRAYNRANMIPRFCGNCAESRNPLASPYAGSFLAAFRGALLVVKSDLLSFELFPARYHRWWIIWKSFFILGSIVCKSPKLAFAATALQSLQEAVELVEAGATHSFLAAGCLPSLRRLRNTAQVIFTAIHPEVIIPPRPPLSDASVAGPDITDLADDRDFEVLAGSHAVLHPGTLPAPSAPSRSVEAFPHPPSQDIYPAAPSLHLTEEMDVWSLDQLNALLYGNTAPVQPTVYSDVDDTGVYAAAIQLPAVPEYSQASFAPEIMDIDWTSFLSSFENPTQSSY
ncbi:fungal-specific transcription factor domain-containing protein [Mycena amicta]|nr:fungal-specific transcription factor domain-containing protein [Mycena amicta]